MKCTSAVGERPAALLTAFESVVSGDVNELRAPISVRTQSDVQSIHGHGSKTEKAVLQIRTKSLLTESEIMKLAERERRFKRGKCLVQTAQKFVSPRDFVKQELFGACVLQKAVAGILLAFVIVDDVMIITSQIL